MKRREFTTRLLLAEGLGFAALIGILWLDEILGHPHDLFGAPFMVAERVFDSAAILLVAILVIRSTLGLLRELDHLKGLLSICAGCKRIRDKDGNWTPVEGYIQERSEAEFSHGLCPECTRRLYPEITGASDAEEASGSGGPRN